MACDVCGRTPSQRIRLRKQSGKVIRVEVSYFDRAACRDCARGAFRDVQAHDLAWGWWGFAALVTNLGAIAGNARAIRPFRSLGEPTGPATKPPLAPGAPLFLRPQMGVPLLLVVAVSVLASPDVSGVAFEDVEIGQCVDRPVQAEFDFFNRASCEEPHDLQVVAVFAAYDATTRPDAQRRCDSAAAAVGVDLARRRLRVLVFAWGRESREILGDQFHPHAVLCAVEAVGARLDRSVINS